MSFIFGLRRVSLAEYNLVLRVYSHLLQMTCSITATTSIVSTLRGMKTRSWGMIIYVILSYCYCWIWLWNWFVFELSVCGGLKLLCFHYLWTRVVIAMWTPMYEILVNYLWNGCNMWLVMWITMILVVCKLVWNPSWFQLTTGFICVDEIWSAVYLGVCPR